MQKGSECTPSHHDVTAGVTAGVTTDISAEYLSPPSLNILASMLSGVLPTGKFEGRQQLRSDRAHVAVFADHAPPPKLEGIVEEVDIDDYTDSE